MRFFNKEYCLCGLHVHTVTKQISMWAISGHIIPAILTHLKSGKIGSSTHRKEMIYLSISAVTYIFLLIGNRFNWPKLYIPFIFNNIIICSVLIWAFFRIVIDQDLSFVDKDGKLSEQSIIKDLPITTYQLVLIIFSIILLIYFYALNIIWRDWKYVQKERYSAVNTNDDRANEDKTKDDKTNDVELNETREGQVGGGRLDEVREFGSKSCLNCCC